MITTEQAREDLKRFLSDYSDLLADHQLLAMTYERVVAELAALREANRWIPVTERLPNFRDRVHVYMQNDYEIIATFYTDHWTHDGGMRVETKVVTHWRRLSLPPDLHQNMV